MTHPPRRRAVLAIGLLSAALSGCGFRPVYMRTASGKPGVAERELAAIDVALISDRPGQLLRQALQERFASDSVARHRYFLVADYRIAGEGVGVQVDNSPSRVRLTGTVNWVLTARDTAQARLTSGSAQSIDGYNVFNEQIFAATLQNEVVEKRLAESLADQVALQLATWFNRRADQAAG